MLLVACDVNCREVNQAKGEFLDSGFECITLLVAHATCTGRPAVQKHMDSMHCIQTVFTGGNGGRSAVAAYRIREYQTLVLDSMGLKRRSVSRIQSLRVLRQLVRIALIACHIIGNGPPLCARALCCNHLIGKG